MQGKQLVAVAALVAAATVVAQAGSQRPVEIPERFRGAERAVVARVSEVTPRMERNRFGDELIVSHVRLNVEETLKGAPATTVDVVVEGGTIGDLTLSVSDMPEMKAGDRAVFFLAREAGTQRFVPHLRGQGVVRLDAEDHVPGSSLTLAKIREMGQSSR